MAKAKSQAQAAPVRRRRSRELNSEYWNRVIIVGGVVAVILIAIGVIGFGWYQTHVRPLNKTVLTVEDTKVSLAHLIRRMKLERKENPAFAQVNESLANLPTVVLDQLELEAKLIASAGDLGITVTDDDMAKEVKTQGNLADDVEASVFAAEFNRQVKDSGLKANEYRQKLKARLVEERVRNYFVFLAPSTETQVKALWLATDSQEKAQEGVQRLDAGEAFDAVAPAVSLAGTSTPAHGEVDWIARGGSAILPREAQDWLFDNAQVGQHSAAIEAGNLFYIVQLEDRADDRPLADTQRQVVGGRNAFDWITSLNTKLKIKRDLTDADKGRALSRVV